MIQNICYTDDHPQGSMDIYFPSAPRKEANPCVVLIHGGGWAIGDKADERERNMASCLTEHGFTVASINYKLTEYTGEVFNSPIKTAAWPQNIFDCKSAIRYLRKYAAEYRIDPDLVGLIGSSAGGHLALLTALSPNEPKLNDGGDHQSVRCDVRCVIDMYGIPDVRIWGGGNFLGSPIEEDPESWDLASPVEHLSNATPPILIIHGDKDKTVDVAQSHRFVEILKQRDADFQFIEVSGGVHSFDFTPPQMDLRPAVLEFLEQHLK